jgi:dihydropteroate synthase
MSSAPYQGTLSFTESGAATVNAKFVVSHIPTNTQQTFEVMFQNMIEILDYFKLKVELLSNAGLSDIILDPGFGFGKNLNHNLELLRSLESFSVLNLPILAGLSRKKMIRDIANVEVEDSLNATVAVNMIALINSAKILRVHDVKAAVQTIKIYNAVFQKSL